jgi:hypothetical protein
LGEIRWIHQIFYDLDISLDVFQEDFHESEKNQPNLGRGSAAGPVVLERMSCLSEPVAQL